MTHTEQAKGSRAMSNRLKHTNNAGQTPKNIRITQVGEEVKRIGGEMTNYNEKLDKILSYEYEVEGCQALHSGSKCLHCNGDPCPHCKRWGGRQRTEVRSMVDKKTRQALASLIKELVTEAKPEKKSTEDYGSWEEGHRNAGWNNCLEHYEHNLLKALEEV